MDEQKHFTRLTSSQKRSNAISLPNTPINDLYKPSFKYANNQLPKASPPHTAHSHTRHHKAYHTPRPPPPTRESYPHQPAASTAYPRPHPQSPAQHPSPCSLHDTHTLRADSPLTDSDRCNPAQWASCTYSRPDSGYTRRGTAAAGAAGSRRARGCAGCPRPRAAAGCCARWAHPSA